MKRIFILLAATLLLASCSEKKQQTLSRDEIKSIAEETYVFGLPYVLEYRTMYMQAVDTTSKSYVGFGNFLHYGATTPKDKDVMTPNRDTPYSWAWVDLRTEPWVYTVPAIDSTEHRYFTTQWNDLAGFVLDNTSALTDGYAGGDYLIVPPTWNGETPAGIKRVIKGETDFVVGLTRIELFSDKDAENVKKIQQGFKLQPLSKFLGQEAPKPAPAVDFYPYVEGTDATPAFFDCLAFILKYSTPNPMDKPTLDKMAQINVIPGANWTALAEKDTLLLNAAKDGMTAIRDTMAIIAKMPRSAGEDTGFANREIMKTNYMERAIGAYLGLFGNTIDQAFYANWGTDNKGEPLDGAKHDYSVTFAKNQLPEYKFFWSVTMYDMAQRYLVENPINRYSIGSRTPGLKYNKDGSLTLYIQYKSPGKDKESNWLPAPDAPFYCVIRFYGPDENVKNGTWKSPEIIAVR